MATNNNIRTFFQAVKTGSVDTLKELQLKIDPKELTKMSKLFTHEGETPLLLAIRGCHLEMVKFLIEDVKVNKQQFGRLIWKGTMDYMEVPPLFAALIYDHIPEQSITNFLIEQQDHDEFLKVMTSFFFSPIPWTQKIEIFELIGAGYLLKKPFDAEMAACGLHYWKQSLRLRHGNLNRPSFPKTPYHLSHRDLNVFGNATEFSTVEEILEMGGNYICNFQTQALLVFHRIMSQFDFDPHPFFLHRLLQYSEDWLDLERTIDTAIFILEPFEARQWVDVVNSDWAFKIVEDLLEVMLAYSINMRPIHSELGFAYVMLTAYFASSFASKMRNYPELYEKGMREVVTIVDFVELKRLLQPFNQKEQKEWENWIVDVVQDVEGPSCVGYSLLHGAVSKNPVIPIDLLHLYLDAGANPNSIDVNGSTPLHFLANNIKAVNISTVLKLFLDSGAFLDKVSLRGVSPRDLFKHNLAEYKSQERANVFSLINVVRPLSCHCAQVICRKRIPFEREDLPHPVLDIIRLHGAAII